MREFINITKQLLEELEGDGEECPQCPRPRALIVEDDQNDAELMTEALRAMGVDSWVVGDAYEAMNVLGKESFRILFLDLKLPKIHGTQLLRQIRDNYPDTHTIIVTGTLDPWSASELAEIGGYCGLVTKPLIRADVEEILRKHNYKK